MDGYSIGTEIFNDGAEYFSLKKVELVAPAGNLEKLCFALHYGADAVYVGGERFNLRQQAGNFTFDELCIAREKTQKQGTKLYIAVNIFARNQDIESLPGYLERLNNLHVDGLIISDPGVFLCAREYAPDTPIIISTQANSCNWKTLHFWERLGAKKICLARELSLKEIKHIRERTVLELEAFVHGAMCVAYSGRCLLSNYFVQRNSNSGNCAQPCRWKYHLVEESRLEDSLKIEEDSLGTYFLNSKDLCMIEHLPKLIECGINSLKIEGRMKSFYYLSVVTRVYREAIDSYYEDPKAYCFKESWREELMKVNHRGYTTGFYFDSHPQDTQLYSHSAHRCKYRMTGFVCHKSDNHKTKIDVRNQISIGDIIEIFSKSAECSLAKVIRLWNTELEPVETLHPGTVGYLEADKPLKEFDILRKAMD